MPIELDFSDIFESGIYTNAEYCRKLEKKMSEMYKCEALVCSSGTAGLILAMHYFCIDKYVFLPVFNWFSDLYTIKLLHKKPLYSDINKYSWLCDDDQEMELRLHTFGNADNSLEEKCIYDGTHALATDLKELGLATIISFAPTKLVTSGEGGIILLKKETSEFAKTEIKEYRDRCFRMSEFHAKIGLEYLKHLDEFLSWKKKVYEYYSKNINGQFQEVPYSSNYNTIGFLNLEKLTIPKEIEIKQYYQPLEAGFKNADYVYNNIVVLPSYYQCDYKLIVDLINEANKI